MASITNAAVMAEVKRLQDMVADCHEALTALSNAPAPVAAPQVSTNVGVFTAKQHTSVDNAISKLEAANHPEAASKRDVFTRGLNGRDRDAMSREEQTKVNAWVGGVFNLVNALPKGDGAMANLLAEAPPVPTEEFPAI